MSLLKPRSLFAVEDDGLIQRLDFSDDEEELKNDLDSSAEFDSSSPRAPSPIHRSNDRSFSSPSEDERMNSSSDSLMSSTMLKPLLKKRLNEQTSNKPRVDTTPPYRKVRALRLFGSPQSPKTLLKQSELSTVEAGRRIVPRIVVQKSGDDVSHNGMQKSRPMFAMYRSSPKLETNINPFYQQDMFQGSQCKRRRDSGICG